MKMKFIYILLALTTIVLGGLVYEWRSSEEAVQAEKGTNSNKGSCVNAIEDAIKYIIQDDVGGMNAVLEGGVPANADYDGKSLLHWAVIHSSVNAARSLLQHGADVNAYDDSGLTPLMRSITERQMSGDHAKIISILLDYHADPNRRDAKDRISPIHIAVNTGDIRVVEALVSHGASVSALMSEHVSALHRAVISKRSDAIDIVKFLVNHSADTNAKAANGMRPLHFAAKNGVYGSVIIDYLAQSHADVNAVDNDGNSPLHIAVTCGNTANVKALLDNGASSALKNKEGHTPIDIATAKGNKEIVSELGE